MRRLAAVLATSAALAVPLLATGTAAAAAPDPLEKVDVFFRGDGSVCVTYDDLTTACTSRIE